MIQMMHCAMFRKFLNGSHFQKEQKSIQEDKSEKRRVRLLCRTSSQAWISSEGQFLIRIRLWALRALPPLCVLE